MFICALVVSFAALALRARAANDTTRAQINNIPSKSHVIPLFKKLKIRINSAGNSQNCLYGDVIIMASLHWLLVRINYDLWYFLDHQVDISSHEYGKNFSSKESAHALKKCQ